MTPMACSGWRTGCPRRGSTRCCASGWRGCRIRSRPATGSGASDYDVSILLAVFARTEVFDRPAQGRVFFDEVRHEHLDLGRPAHVQLILDRRATRRTPSRYRTRVLTDGVTPSVHVDYKHPRIKQHYKEGRALRTETVINETYDVDVGRRLSNPEGLKQIGFTASRRLLGVQRLSHDATIGADVRDKLHRPVRIDGQRAPPRRFGERRVQALLAGVLRFELLPRGFRNRDLREAVASRRALSLDDYGTVQRAKIVLLLADGVSARTVEAKLDVPRPTIPEWRRRFLQHGVEGLTNRHWGRPRWKLTVRLRARVLAVKRRPPPDGTTHWSCRRLAAHLGVDKNIVQRVWRKADLRPHRLAGYMASNDPDFERQAADIIVLYLDPPRHAAVFCIDEKTAIQALDRRDRMLPLLPGRVERHGFEYKRHGTLPLYAALNVQTGEVQGKATARHTRLDFVGFLGEVVATRAADEKIHVILDYLSTHKTS